MPARRQWVDGFKVCTGCGVRKHEAEYSRASNGWRSSRCKECRSKEFKAWRLTRREEMNARNRERYDPDAQRRYRLKYLYGLTPDARSALLDKQGGVCPICRTDEDLVVDHDHDTGIVRGLLCRRCNSAVGLLQDDPAMCRRAVAYLENIPDHVPEDWAVPKESV